MLKRIVDKINAKRSLKRYVGSVHIIDDDTLLFLDTMCLYHEVENIIKQEEFKIIDSICYNIMEDGELRTEDEAKEIIKTSWGQYKHQGHRVNFILILKLQKDPIEKVYEKWIQNENKKQYIRVKDLIKFLKEVNQDAIIGFQDEDWDINVLEHPNNPIKISKFRDCPDCINVECRHCKKREIFEREYVVI